MQYFIDCLVAVMQLNCQDTIITPRYMLIVSPEFKRRHHGLVVIDFTSSIDTIKLEQCSNCTWTTHKLNSRADYKFSRLSLLTFFEFVV